MKFSFLVYTTKYEVFISSGPFKIQHFYDCRDFNTNSSIAFNGCTAIQICKIQILQKTFKRQNKLKNMKIYLKYVSWSY